MSVEATQSGQEPNPQTQVVGDAAADSTSTTAAPQSGESTDTTTEKVPAYVQAELDRARKEAASYRAKLKKLESAQEAATAKALEEQGKFKELYESAQKTIAELSPYKTMFGEVIESEISSVPEHLRELVPAGSDAEKLSWIRKAKASGLFAPPTPAAPPKPPSTAVTAPPPPGGGAHKPEQPTAGELQELGMPWTSSERKAAIKAKLAAYQKSQG